MMIKVRRKDKTVHSVQELLGYNNYTKPLLKDNQIRVRKAHFSVNKNVRKDYAFLIENGNDFFIMFSDENSFSIPPFLSKVTSSRHYKRRAATGEYGSPYLRSRIGEGIFEFEKLDENLYKIIHPKK